MEDNKELKDKIKFKIAMSEIYDEENLKSKTIKNNIYSKIASVACFILLISGALFADAISEKVVDIYNFRKKYNIETKLPEEVVNDSERLEEVVNNKNSIIPWTEDAADTIESENLKIDISRVDMDNYYMSFEGSINFPEEVIAKMPIENIYLVRFPDLVIRDENDNILFCMEENKLKEIFKTDDIEAIKNNQKYCISEVRDYGFKNYEKLGSNPYDFEYCLNTKIPSIYPKSKKLIFEFNKIALDAPEASYGIDDKHYLHQDQSLTVLGNWKIEIDVPRKYYEREDIIPYKIVQSDPDSKNELYYCYYKDDAMHAFVKLSSINIPSGPWGSVKIEDMLTELDVNPIIKQYIIYKICSTDEYKQREAEQDKVYEIDDYYVENSNGKRSKMPGIYSRDGDEMIPASKTHWSGGIGVRNGILDSGEISGFDEKGNWYAPDGMVLDIDKEDLTDEMTFHVKYLGKDIIFKLEKMKGDK